MREDLGTLHSARAKKSLGQHFLFDLNLTRKIVRQAGDLEGQTVFEIGPGPGGLTRALLETKLQRLILIEKDARFASEWSARAADDPRLIVLEADALEVDEAAILRAQNVTEPAHIIANLPYNVGTPLLLKWLKAKQWRGRMALMFQLEVAERICAHAGDAAYGRLSVMAQSCMKPSLMMKIPAAAFTPPPKVDSAVVLFEQLPEHEEFHKLEALEKVTAAAFGQRRKMLRQSLKALCASVNISVSDFLAHASLEATARPETIPPAGFQRLASLLIAATGDNVSAKAATEG